MGNIFKKKCVCSIVIFVMMITLTACSKGDLIRGVQDTKQDSQETKQDSQEINQELQGTKSDSNIAKVQNGYPVLIPNITYKEAYNYFFSDPQWRGFEADDGSHVVEFSGGCLYYEEDATVYIQFVIEDDSFSMWYASIAVGDEMFVADGEMFIDLVYAPFATYSEEVLGETLSEDVRDAFYSSLEN